MGIKALDPKAYETFRTSHDCVLVKRKEEGTMMDYALPPIPQVETKKWAQTTPIEMLHTQLSSELKKDKDRKEASAEEARQIRQAATTAQADRLVRPPPRLVVTKITRPKKGKPSGDIKNGQPKTKTAGQ